MNIGFWRLDVTEKPTKCKEEENPYEKKNKLSG